MNRPIKFRAWDGETMSKPFVLSDICNECGTYNGPTGHSMGECEIMQYTGLKDKNGKEIYEGDILEIDGDLETVEWDNDRAKWNGVYASLWANGSSLPEIIGNVFDYRNNHMPKDKTSDCCNAPVTVRGGCDDRGHGNDCHGMHTMHNECNECGEACGVD